MLLIHGSRIGQEGERNKKMKCMKCSDCLCSLFLPPAHVPYRLGSWACRLLGLLFRTAQWTGRRVIRGMDELVKSVFVSILASHGKEGHKLHRNRIRSRQVCLLTSERVVCIVCVVCIHSI